MTSPDDISGMLAELLAEARSKVAPPSPGADALRIVYGVREAAPLELLTAAVAGRCPGRCNNGWLFGDAAYRCRECRPLHSLAERTNAAALPARLGGVLVSEMRDAWSGQQSLPTLARWASRALETRRGPLLYGRKGRGKTWTAAAVALAALDAGASMRWVSWPALPYALRQAYAAGRTGADILHTMARVDLLVMDDLGAESGGREWLDDVAYQVLAPRADAGRPIVATTNLCPEQLADAIGDRAHSRLMACCRAVEVGGEDRRLA